MKPTSPPVVFPLSPPVENSNSIKFEHGIAEGYQVIDPEDDDIQGTSLPVAGKITHIRSLVDYLMDINNYANRAMKYTDNITYAEFVDEERDIQAATIRCLTVMVEAARQLTHYYPDFAKAHVELFKQIRSMKKIVCIYHTETESIKVWELVKTIVPELINGDLWKMALLKAERQM